MTQFSFGYDAAVTVVELGGGLRAPASVSVTTRDDVKGVLVELRLEFTAGEKRPRCRQVLVTGFLRGRLDPHRADYPMVDVTTENMRLPITKWTDEATAEIVTWWTHVEPTRTARGLQPATDQQQRRVAEQLPLRRHRTLTALDLQRVAQLAQKAAAEGLSAVRQVAEGFYVSDRTAARYLSQAKHRGLLPAG